MSKTCTRRLQFCAGHRVLMHESKCAHFHGHNYVVHLTARATDGPELDGVGRVIDFAVLKAKFGDWIDTNWDHGFIASRDDIVAIRLMASVDDVGNGTRQKLFLLPYNPTAENLADYLLRVVGPELLQGTGIELCGVVVTETENCSAEDTL